MPSLKFADFKHNRERFEGYGLALMARAVEEAAKLDTTKFPKDSKFDVLKEEIQAMATLGAAKIQKALQAATALPLDSSSEVLAAYADGLKKDTFKFAMTRLGDSQTAQICVFLVFSRPLIEAGRMSNVTVLFENFMKIREAFPGQKEFFRKHPQARDSLEQHFRRICSADGVKLARRGQPKKK